MPTLRVAITLGVPSFSLGLRRWFYVCWWGQMAIKPHRSPSAVLLCVCVSSVGTSLQHLSYLCSAQRPLCLTKAIFSGPGKKPHVCVSCTHLHCRGKCLFWQIEWCWEGNAPACEGDHVCISLCVHHDLLLSYTKKRASASISQLRREGLQGESGLRACCSQPGGDFYLALKEEERLHGQHNNPQLE